MADLRLRPARKDDAEALAPLIDIAGEGFGMYLWSQAAKPGETALEIGKRRAQREEGGFSYRHATIAEVDRRVAGLLLGTVCPNPMFWVMSRRCRRWYGRSSSSRQRHRGPGT